MKSKIIDINKDREVELCICGCGKKIPNTFFGRLHKRFIKNNRLPYFLFGHIYLSKKYFKFKDNKNIND